MDESDNEEDLVIDTSPKYKTRSRKRKRISSTSSNDFVLTSNSLELEKNLQASALKNNLDDTSVKKIIKKVVTNDHVLALVKLREEEEGSSTEEDVPTLTRSKAKTVKKIPRVTAPWNLQLEPIEHIPVKTRPEVEALIAQELPEDEDDDEYEPTNDDIPSDDDHMESCSDLDSQPRTPATPRRTESPRVLKDGPFKVPQEISTVSRKLNLEEEATIALRTRSKLSLSSTPIEHIESSFVPPDDLPQTDVDEIWNNFLKECLNPVPSGKNEDDDDADPEYNVAADPDAAEDEEGLENSIIKISKKELEDILTELCQVMPQPEKDIQNTQEAPVTSVSNDTVHWDGKREIVSDEETPAPVMDRRGSRLSIGKTEPLDDDENDAPCQETETEPAAPSYSAPLQTPPVVAALPKDVTMAVQDEVAQLLGGGEGDSPAVVKIVNTPREVVLNIDGAKLLPEQRLLLEQQLRQHIQLCASHFMQVCVNPKFWPRAATYRENLESFKKIADSNPSSVVNVCNLYPAVELIDAYEKTVTAVTPENEEMVKFIADEMERMNTHTSNKRIYRGQFPETFRRVVAGSSVFLYPYLLPPSPFRPYRVRRLTYLRPEDELIALGLEQFFWYVEHNPELFPRKCGRQASFRGLQAATALVCRHMMPWTTPQVLASHITIVRKVRDNNNPIYKFIKNRTVEPLKHKLLPFDPKRTLYDQPEHEMPRSWVTYLAKTDRRFRSYLYKRMHVNGSEPTGVEIDSSKILSNSPPKPSSLPIPPPRTYNKEKKKEEVIVTTTPTLTVATRVYNLVTTSNGIVLVPQTGTLATSVVNTPICSVVETPIDRRTSVEPKATDNAISFVKIAEKPQRPEISKLISIAETHCKCCVLLRKICRTRQALITEFFRGTKSKCPCQSVKRPKMTNKLKLLIKYYVTHSKTVYSKVKYSLQESEANASKVEEVTDEVNKEEDTAFVLSFIMKLAIRMSTLKAVYPKQRIHEILEAFDIHTGNPLFLAADLSKFLGMEDVDLYKEFMGFLTPEQADRLMKFKEYFINICMEDYLKKIEEGIPNKAHRCGTIEKLSTMFGKSAASSCDWCYGLLETLREYPTLAEYTFYLFPHRRKEQENFCKNTLSTNTNKNHDIDKEATTGITTLNVEQNANKKSVKPKTVQNKINNKPKSRTPIVNKINSKSQTTVNNTQNSNSSTTDSPKILNITSNSDPLKITCTSSNHSSKTAEKANSKSPKTSNKKPNRRKKSKIVSEDETSSGEEDAMSLCDNSDDEADDNNASSDGEHSDKQAEKESSENTFEVKEEPSEIYEITYTTTEVQHRHNGTKSDVEGEVKVKIEPLEWKREEDKALLELMKKSLADGKTKTIYDIVESQSEIFLKCCENRTILDITNRLFHLLQVVNET